MTDTKKLVPELIWLDNNKEGARWSVDQSLCIGREHADINIPVDAVSRRHAEVHLTSGYYEIEDLDSRNGSAVNGNLLRAGEKQALRDGDIVLLAGMVELRFTDPLATAAAPRIGRLRGLWIDEESSDVWIDAKKLHPVLSSKQQRLLELVYQADGDIVTRDQIVASVWDYASPEGISNDAVDSLIKRLRKRLAEYTDKPVVELVRDKGIRLVVDG